METKLVLNAKEASLYTDKHIGGKAGNMAWMSRQGFPVPDWFVVTTRSYKTQMAQNGLHEEIKKKLAQIDENGNNIDKICRDIRQSIITGKLHDSIQAAIKKEMDILPDKENPFFAVRSSIVGEDAKNASFAGQMDSFLFQKGLENIYQSVLSVFASAYSSRAIKYRLNNHLGIENIEAAVIIQRMIDSQVSGVFFTAHPATGDRKKGIISACYGSGEGIVSGECNTDEYTVELYGNLIEPVISDKDCQLVFDMEKGTGLKKINTDKELRKRPCLTDLEIGEIRKTGCRISEQLYCPQDIEWALSEGQLYILQTRPITSLPDPVSPKGTTTVWDNSNIQESYYGVTSPLTFSFASRAYKSVYTQTYQVLGVPQKTLDSLEPALKNLLGLIKGRVYYNINNWYRCLLVLPFFKTNKADMERMMGLQDPVDFVEEKRLTVFEKIKKLPGLFKALYHLLKGFRQLDDLVTEFSRQFKKEYDTVDRKRLHTFEIPELMELCEKLRTNLIGKWQTPIINDFYVMIMNGKVHRWLEKCGVENPNILQNNLMSGEEGIESAEPTKYLLRMRDYVNNSPALLELFKGTPNSHLLPAIQTEDPAFHKECLDYIERYGDRCMGELKLESVTLRQDPSFIFSVIKNYLTQENLTIQTLIDNEMKFRSDAENQAFKLVEEKFGKKKLEKFKKELTKLRMGVKNRENMRMARTRAFGLARDIYVEIGRQLAFYKLIDAPEDIFYLTEQDLDTYMDGRCVQSDFKTIISARKSEFSAYENEELPHHFKTTGMVYHNNTYKYESSREIKESDHLLEGIGCYPGVVEGKVKIILSPKDELDLNGQILCAERTDPGWAPLFPAAGGILVERGSTLSHSAVVARELGIPAIVNIPGLTRILKTDETIKMDGSEGTVERLDHKKKTKKEIS